MTAKNQCPPDSTSIFSTHKYLTHTIEGQKVHIGDIIEYIVVGYFFHTLAQAQNGPNFRTLCSHMDWVV